MAIKVKTKPKKTISRAAIKGLDLKAYGMEPLVVDTEDTSAYRDVLNWYNYMHDQDQAREWLLEYMKKNGFEKAAIADVRRCPKHQVPTTVGWQARIMMNGNKLSEKSMNFFNQNLDRLYAIGIKHNKEETVVAEKPVVDIQARVRDKANMIITNIEEEIDLVVDGKEFSMYSFCQANELTPQVVNIIADYYRPQHDEILSNDDQVKESFGKKQKFWINFWNNFFADIDRYVNNKKAVKVRKPREKKQKSAIDLVKSLKFQKEDPSLKIVSVHPAEVVGCSQLWTYNTKYKKLTRYDSSGPSGIQVKGTTLTGFDVETSVSKSLRKPDITIQSLLGAGKVSLRKFMDELKTVASVPNGRINQDTILLRVIK